MLSVALIVITFGTLIAMDCMLVICMLIVRFIANVCKKSEKCVFQGIVVRTSIAPLIPILVSPGLQRRHTVLARVNRNTNDSVQCNFLGCLGVDVHATERVMKYMYFAAKYMI